MVIVVLEFRQILLHVVDHGVPGQHYKLAGCFPQVEDKVIAHTGCIEGFSGAENCIENAMKITNSISIFYPLKSVMDVKLFLLCHS